MNYTKESPLLEQTAFRTITMESATLSVKYNQSTYKQTTTHTNYLIIKRWMDITISLIILAVTLPFFIFLIIVIGLTNPGAIFYKQVRIGKDYKSFTMYKFRTMIVNAENGIPVCAEKNDPRITRLGKWLRKTHADELPNLINVLKGDMSLIGPRPERQFFIERITINAPEFLHLLTIKPGVTSWGQIKYGYARNVPEMIQRMHYDLPYVQNTSFKTDISILFQTFLLILNVKSQNT